MEDYEGILLVKPEVFVYKIPPRTTVRGYRAADWNLGSPDWTGRMRLVCKKKTCILKLEDKMSGELFAQCPIDTYPSTNIEAVTDSSRYFVVRIQSDDEKSAFIGLGFGDRSDSFDLNVALQDHFKWVNMEEESKKEQPERPGLDLGFKDGQTIKINMKITKKDGQEGSTARPKPRNSGTGLLPPPPGGVKSLPSVPKANDSGDEMDLMADLPQAKSATTTDSWGEFTSASAANDGARQDVQPKPESTTPSGGSGWVTF